MKTISDGAAVRAQTGKVLIFKPLGEQELTALLGIASIITYDEGEKIVSEGDVSSSFFIVLDGTVHVMVRQQGKEVFICSLGEGDVFGEAAMFLKVKRTADVVAAGPVTLMQIRRPDLMGFIRKFSVAGNKLLLVIVYGLLRKLRGANQELAFERRSDIDQDDVDALVAEIAGR